MSEWIFVGISAVVATCNNFVTGYNYAAYRHFIECICFFACFIACFIYFSSCVIFVCSMCYNLFIMIHQM